MRDEERAALRKRLLALIEALVAGYLGEHERKRLMDLMASVLIHDDASSALQSFWAGVNAVLKDRVRLTAQKMLQKRLYDLLKAKAHVDFEVDRACASLARVPELTGDLVEKKLEALETGVRDWCTGHLRSHDPEGPARAQKRLGQFKRRLAALQSAAVADAKRKKELGTEGEETVSGTKIGPRSTKPRRKRPRTSLEPSARRSPDEYRRRINELTDLLLNISERAVIRLQIEAGLIEEVVSAAADSAADPKNVSSTRVYRITRRGEELMSRRPAFDNLATAEYFFLVMNWKPIGATKLVLARHEERELVTMAIRFGAEMIRGNQIAGLGTYADERTQDLGLASVEQAELMRIGNLEQLERRLEELRPDLRGVAKARLLARLYRRRFLHKHEQARFPGGALAEVLAVLGVQLGFWTMAEYYGAIMPMRGTGATTATDPTSGPRSYTEPGPYRDVIQAIRNVIAAFIEQALRPENASAIEAHPELASFLPALFSVLEAEDPTEQAVRADALAEEGAVDLLKSPARVEDPSELEPPRPLMDELDVDESPTRKGKEVDRSGEDEWEAIVGATSGWEAAETGDGEEPDPLLLLPSVAARLDRGDEDEWEAALGAPSSGAVAGEDEREEADPLLLVPSVAARLDRSDEDEWEAALAATPGWGAVDRDEEDEFEPRLSPPPEPRLYDSGDSWESGSVSSPHRDEPEKHAEDEELDAVRGPTPRPVRGGSSDRLGESSIPPSTSTASFARGQQMQLDVLEVPNDGICLLNALLRSGCGGTAEQLLALMKRVAPAVLEKHSGFVDDFDDALEQWRIVTLEAFRRGRWGHRAFDLAPVIAAEALNCTIVICDALQQVIAAYGSGEPVLFIISTPNHFDGAKRRG